LPEEMGCEPTYMGLKPELIKKLKDVLSVASLPIWD